jgi:hypothetical protein
MVKRCKFKSSCTPCACVEIVQIKPIPLFGWATLVPWLQQQSTAFLGRGAIGWYVNRLPVSTPMGTIFQGLYSLALNNHRTGLIWITLTFRNVAFKLGISTVVSLLAVLKLVSPLLNGLSKLTHKNRQRKQTLHYIPLVFDRHHATIKSLDHQSVESIN